MMANRHVQRGEQDESSPSDAQQNGECFGHSARKTKIRIKGVTRNSSMESKPADSQHLRQLAGEGKRRNPAPNARKVTVSRTCSASTTRPPLRRHRLDSANQALRSGSPLNSWIASNARTT